MIAEGNNGPTVEEKMLAELEVIAEQITDLTGMVDAAIPVAYFAVVLVVTWYVYRLFAVNFR